MPDLKKLLTLNKAEYFKIHLSLMNCMLPRRMTPMEIEVLSAFLGLDGDIAAYRFGPSAKKLVMKQLKLSPAGLSNHMVSLTKKTFLRKTGDVISILPVLMPGEHDQVYMFKLVRNDEAPDFIKKEEKEETLIIVENNNHE